MNILKVDARKPDEDPVRAGRLDGKRLFLRAVEEIPSPAEPVLLVLDFSGVDLATSSFLSEAVFPLRDHLRLRRPPSYIILANLKDQVREELEDLLSRMGDALLSCDFSGGQITRVQLIGRL